jgi:alpha-beta hydrolase superfamily lysophospholipase
MIEPFFFDNQRLFGCYFPSADQNSNRLLVICPPLFSAYTRCYAALSELALSCAEEGVHVLRFDYFGTGESMGELGDVTEKEWERNIAASIEEGIALTGATEVILAGVRLGATLAAQISHPNVSKKVFWDPILRGDDFLKWMALLNRELEIMHLRSIKASKLKPQSIKYELVSMSDKLITYIQSLGIDPQVSEDNYIISTQEDLSPYHEFKHKTYSGYSYSWPGLQKGVIIPKPVLKMMAQKITAL